LIRGAGRRGGDSGGVWHGGDGSERLGGLLEARGQAISTSVDTREVLVVTKARLENTILVSSWGIVVAANTVKDVVTELGGVGVGLVASLEAENVRAHEVVPFNDLGDGSASSEGVGEDKPTEWVATEISTMGVHLSSSIISSHVDEGLVDVAGDLNVCRGPHELNTSDGTGGDGSGPMRRVRAPGNGRGFCVTDSGVGDWRTPEAEVGNGVDEGGLAIGLLVGSGRVANVEAELRTTSRCIGIDLVWDVGPGEAHVRKRHWALRSDGGSEAGDSNEGEHFYKVGKRIKNGF